MKINKSSTNHRKKSIVITVLILTVLLTAGGLFIYFTRHNTSPQSDTKGINSIDYGPPTTEQEKAGNQINNPDKVGSDPLPDPVPQSNGKGLIDVAITSINQGSSGVQVNSLISAVTSNGTCTLTLIKDTARIQKTAGVQPLPSSSTCKGFTVPLSELSKGTWELNLTFENESLTGSTKQTMEIQ